MTMKRIFNTYIALFALTLSIIGAAQELDVYSLEQQAININTADAGTIAANLSGIGMQKAEDIVLFREQNGDFESLDDLKKVKGIGDATVQKNEKKIIFN